MYSAIKSEDLEELDSGTIVSWAASGGVWWNRNVLMRLLETVDDVVFVLSAGRLFHNVGAETLKERLS